MVVFLGIHELPFFSTRILAPTTIKLVKPGGPPAVLGALCLFGSAQHFEHLGHAAHLNGRESRFILKLGKKDE